MQTETLVGLISGLGGAVIGLGGAVGGAWMQQRWQAQTARRERMDGYSRKAGETALDALVQIQQVVFNFSRDYGDSAHDQLHSQVITKVLHHSHVAKTAVLTIGDAAVRERLDEVLQVMIEFHAVPEIDPEKLTRARCLWFLNAATEGMGILSAFLRSESLPSNSEGYIEQMLLVANADHNRS